jgi:hypothetical protein
VVKEKKHHKAINTLSVKCSSTVIKYQENRINSTKSLETPRSVASFFPRMYCMYCRSCGGRRLVLYNVDWSTGLIHIFTVHSLLLTPYYSLFHAIRSFSLRPFAPSRLHAFSPSQEAHATHRRRRLSAVDESARQGGATIIPSHITVPSPSTRTAPFCCT